MPVPIKPARRATPPGRDRLVLSGGGDGGEPSLRLATDLFAWKDNDSAAREAQREILRLEFRTLTALNERATSQLAAAEKLRNLGINPGRDCREAGRRTDQRLETAPKFRRRRTSGARAGFAGWSKRRAAKCRTGRRRDPPPVAVRPAASGRRLE